MAGRHVIAEASSADSRKTHLTFQFRKIALPSLMLRQFKSKLKAVYEWLPIIHTLIQLRNETHRAHQELAMIRDALAVLVEDFWLPGTDRYREPKRLCLHAAQINSQGNEDGVIRELFQAHRCSRSCFR